MDVQKWFEENLKNFSGQIFFDEPLSKHTYYRLGGPASVLAFPKSKEDIRSLAQGIQQTGIQFFILGLGSNILVSDQGFQGLIVRASRANLEIVYHPMGQNQAKIETGGSVAISTLLRRSAQEGWGGLEFLTGIPGSVGGAVFMNAGTHLGETQSRLTRVEIISLLDPDGKVQVFEGKDLQYQYRKNFFVPRGGIVWKAEWIVDLKNPTEVKSQIDETLTRRKSTQPIEYPSCGSVFKNPKAAGVSAWQVIDRLGLRGFQIGGAQFAEKHSNFIINLGNAKASDVSHLIDLAKKRAHEELGISLEEEVIRIGFHSEV